VCADVINRLDALRGKGMARMYSWASKRLRFVQCSFSFFHCCSMRVSPYISVVLQCRSYRNGFVWHDLADDDFIHPVAGREYVLKGTERLHPAPPLPPLHASSSSSETATSSSSGSRWEHGQPAHRKKSASAAEFAQYVVYKVEDLAADAATQTEDGGRGHQRRVAAKPQDDLSREETSPPTASTSPETLEALIKANGRVAAAVAGDAGRAKASSVLMQLISCGSVSVKDAVPPRARPPASVAATDIPSYHSAKTVEDKEYFSGSIVDMTKRSPADDACQDQAVLRRSSSCDADR
jgi:hypothetical protein